MANNAGKRVKAIAKKQTKAQIIMAISEDTGLSKKEVSAVIDSLANHAQRHLMKRGSGEFTVPSLGVKLRRVKRPARAARKGVNPFTGEQMIFAAKPAQNVVRASPLKALKDMVT